MNHWWYLTVPNDIRNGDPFQKVFIYFAQICQRNDCQAWPYKNVFIE